MGKPYLSFFLELLNFVRKSPIVQNVRRKAGRQDHGQFKCYGPFPSSSDAIFIKNNNFMNLKRNKNFLENSVLNTRTI